MLQNYILIDNKTSALNADVLFLLKDLDQKHFPTPWNDSSWNNVFLESGDRLILIDTAHSNASGFVLYDVNVVDSFAHLLKVLVNPERRGQKIGKNLLIESIKILRDRGIKTIYLEVEEDNLIARKLYEDRGFKIIHKKKHFYSNGGTAIIMTLTA